MLSFTSAVYTLVRKPCLFRVMIFVFTSGSLAVEYTWDTQCKSRDAEGAFLICGTLYVVYNTRYGGRSTVQCLYDIHDTIHRLDYRQTHILSHICKPKTSLFRFTWWNIFFSVRSICSDESPVIFFPKRYTSHSSIHYHPGDKQLYTWDDGYQTIYTVETQRNVRIPAAEWRQPTALYYP